MHKMSNRWTRGAVWVGGLGLAALAGCGGGDSAPIAADPSDKYVGTWHSACFPLNAPSITPNLSFKTVATITKVAAASYNFNGGNQEYASANCSGTAIPVVGESGVRVFTIAGSKTVGAVVVDKLTLPNGSKEISYVNGSSLQLGAFGSGVDAEGYPNALDTGLTYTKQ